MKSPVLVTMYVFNFNIYKPASIDIRKPYFLEPSITREPLKDLLRTRNFNKRFISVFNKSTLQSLMSTLHLSTIFGIM